MSAPTPHVQVSRADGRSVVQLINCPRITEANVEAVGGQLDRVAGEAAGQHLVLDLTDVEFITSVGLGKLIGLNGRLRNRGGRLTLRNPSPMVREILAITCLDQVIAVEPSAGESAACPG